MMKLEFLNRLKLGQKLGLISLTFALPILLLSTLYAKQFYEEINLASNKLQGLGYLEKVWPVFFHAAQPDHDEEGSALDPETIKTVEEFGVTHDFRMGTNEEISKFLRSFRSGSNSGQTLKTGLSAMIKIRDGSDLFIDPELDTVYLMDLLTYKLPTVLETTHTLDSTLHLVSESKGNQTSLENELSYSIGQLQTAFVPVNLAYKSLIAASADAQLGLSLENPLEKYLAAQEKYKTQVAQYASKVVVGQSNEAGYEEADAKYLELTASINNLYRITLSEMRRLVEKRLKSLWMSTLLSLGAVLASLAAAGVLVFSTIQSIRNPVGTLVSVIEKLRAGDTKVAVAHINDPNEIGDIARGLESFRTTVDDLEAARQQRENLQSEELLRAKEMGDLAVVINEVVSAAKEGDFTKRVPVSNRTGIMSSLSKGVNDLTETMDRGLSETVRVISALASGDMTQRIAGEFKGSFFKLQTDANSMAEKFRSITSRILGVSQEVQSATREIASGVSDLSVRTEHQASSLQESSASMRELATTVAQNAISAMEVNRVAAVARDVAVSGGEIAGRAVIAMNRIENSSKQISEIVGLIQDIAFQTNLLALNAAVEAARAGDAGKGFAVVANEVRALAQRAGQASKDIKQLIVNSDFEVKEGVALVKQAGTSLGDIVTSVKKVASLVSEISAATQEQSTGIDQVSKAVSGMDQMTQQNAALVEETNAALHSAQSQVHELRQVVGFFMKTEGSNIESSDGTKVISVAPITSATDDAEGVHEKLRSLARKMGAAGTAQTQQAVARGEWREF